LHVKTRAGNGAGFCCAFSGMVSKNNQLPPVSFTATVTACQYSLLVTSNRIFLKQVLRLTELAAVASIFDGIILNDTKYFPNLNRATT